MKKILTSQRLLANSHHETEVLSPIAHEKLKPVNNFMREILLQLSHQMTLQPSQQTHKRPRVQDSQLSCTQIPDLKKL
jgi:hypothetical protein